MGRNQSWIDQNKEVFRGKLTPAGIKINKSKKNSQFFFRNMRQLGAGAAEKLAPAGIQIGLIELKSVDLLRKLAGLELKWAELRSPL